MKPPKVTIELTHSEALVLFDFLARLNARDDFTFEDPAESRVLWDVESALEKSLIEPLNDNYDLLVKRARANVRNHEGV